MNNGCTLSSAFFLKDEAILKSMTENASRLMKSMRNHKTERTDIERLAAALNYDAPQLETDIEDVADTQLIRDCKSKQPMRECSLFPR